MHIISEQESEGHGTLLTNRVLQQLIRFYGDSMQGMMTQYLEQSIGAFLEHQRSDSWPDAEYDRCRISADYDESNVHTKLWLCGKCSLRVLLPMEHRCKTRRDHMLVQLTRITPPAIRRVLGMSLTLVKPMVHIILHPVADRIYHLGARSTTDKQVYRACFYLFLPV